MRDYVRFGWRACFASIGFDLVSLAVVFFSYKWLYHLLPGDKFHIVAGIILFVVITVFALLCRPFYVKGLTTRFPDTHISKSAFLFILYAIALVLAIVLALFYIAVVALFMTELQAGQVSDNEMITRFSLIFMALSSAAYFYFLLYATASAEYVWRKYLQHKVETLDDKTISTML
ncbi:hypothetical protein [Veillonella criceti]|uniref:Uncharacterized protein n=1 Tax=Veillonella criceti TaxID=103891 RepID=A0A380NHV6_9FIRM|nr:hypothetical protein [Veillonella criceti]SUP41095.1 Uncharacterised protein [Veillonella criceti]